MEPLDHRTELLGDILRIASFGAVEDESSASLRGCILAHTGVLDEAITL